VHPYRRLDLRPCPHALAHLSIHRLHVLVLERQVVALVLVGTYPASTYEPYQEVASVLLQWQKLVASNVEFVSRLE